MTLQKIPPMKNKSDLVALLKSLEIRCLCDGNLDDFLAAAQKEAWSPLSIIEQIASRELGEREHRSLKWRLQDSKIGAFLPMASFDWGWPKHIDRPLIETLLSADFVDTADNVILIGAHGLGKTLIAKNIIHQTILKGHTALFVEASRLLVDLAAQESARALEQRLRHYAKPKLLCIDEVGYLSYDQRAADLLFQIIARRYEKKSIIITTNLGFNDWGPVFPGAASVCSLVDRLIHHSFATLIEGESYRKHEAETRKTKLKHKGKSK